MSNSVIELNDQYVPQDGDIATYKSGEKLTYKNNNWIPYVSKTEAFARSFAGNLVQNIANIPAVSEDLVRAVAGGGKLPTGYQPDTSNPFADRRMMHGSERPESPQSNIFPKFPPELGSNIAGAVQGTVSPDMTIVDAQEAHRTRELLGEHQYPAITLTADIAADIATVIAHRNPSAVGRQVATKRTRDLAEKQARKQQANAKQLRDQMDPQAVNATTDMFDDFITRVKQGTPLFKRAGKRAAEAGIQGAYIAALNDEDPRTSMMMGAGLQLAASPSLWFLDTLRRHPLGAGVALANGIAITSILQTIAPGDQDFFGAKDFNVQKMAVAWLVGIAAGLAGGGRWRGQNADMFPRLADALTAGSRTGLNSGLRDAFLAREEGDAWMLKVVERYTRDPDYFGAHLPAIERALTTGNIVKEFNTLMKSDTFGEKVRGLAQPPAGSGNIFRPMEEAITNITPIPN